ncbi:helix-turn-helix domain-containing protein [Agrobacterium rhizogenes]|nr:helix-turn-helix domain-containing protein [Rhizobium rhizogenes]
MYSLTNEPSSAIISETIEDLYSSADYGPPMELNQRIFTARDRAKMTQQQLADAVGKTRGAVAQWEKGDVVPRRATLEAIAKATKVNLIWLERGGDEAFSDMGPDNPRQMVGLPVVGEVSAGVWREGASYYERRYEPVASSPEYPGYGQRLYKVVGDSINRVADTGEYLHCVELHRGGIQPEHGDLVIVQRSQHGRAEYTAKQMIWKDGRWVLRPLSDNPDWQDDIELDGDDDTVIQVTDLVIAKWSPIPRRSLVAKDRNPFR